MYSLVANQEKASLAKRNRQVEEELKRARAVVQQRASISSQGMVRVHVELSELKDEEEK